MSCCRANPQYNKQLYRAVNLRLSKTLSEKLLICRKEAQKAQEKLEKNQFFGLIKSVATY